MTVPIPRPSPFSHRAMLWALAVVAALVPILAPVPADAGVGLDRVPTPAGVKLSGAARMRFDHLDGDFRNDPDALGDLLNTRVNVRAALTRGRLGGALEVMDSRAYLHNDDDRVGTAIVNALEPIDAWLSWTLSAEEGPAVRVRAGRFSQDLGGRRLVGRNRYRNTVNTFDGVDLLTEGEAASVRLLYYRPVNRRPGEGERIGNNDFELDESDRKQWLAGAFATFKREPGGDQIELYLLHLDEDDSGEFATRNRRLTTPGARWLRKPAPGRTDWELEAAFQFGESRASNRATIDLDHFATFAHLEVGHTFAVTGQPRLSVVWDHASGDEDLTDGDNNRWDELFGNPAGDFGPTSIYRPISRANVNMVTLELSGSPLPGVTAALKARIARLDETRDGWVRSGYSNPTGASGRELGGVMESRIRWWAVPKRLQLEFGASMFEPGEYARDVGRDRADDRVTLSWIAATVPL